MFIAAILIFIALLTALYYLKKSAGAVTQMKLEIEALQKANEYLSEREQFLTLVERISHLGSWEIDVEQKRVKWSDELYNIYGFKEHTFQPDETINERVIAPEYREKVLKEVGAAIENKTSFAVEYQIIQPSGIRKYVLGQGFYLEKEHKLVGTIQDITELKDAVLKLKINESLLREAETVSHSGSWEWIDGKEFILWSDEMFTIHGYLPHSVFITFSFYQSLVHKSDLAHFLAQFNEADKDKKAFSINYRIVRPSGEIRHVLSTAEYKLVGLNDRYAYIGNTQDVTELREAQVQLEEKVAELNRSNQDLEQFAYVASHDLQEPLRKIQAFGDRLKGKFSTQLNEEGINYLDRMSNAAERMRNLINDLLTFSKVGRGSRTFSLISLSEVVHKTIRDLELLIESKKAKIIVDCNVEIDGIESQLIQLFQNLIGNSLKFVDTGIQPVIQISAAVKQGAELHFAEVDQSEAYCIITIKDNGIGIADEYVSQIFDIFHRLHSRNDYEGTGIGLAICKKIAINHSGFIFAERGLDNGAIFTTVLPLKQVK